jgi:hypothetical protein
MLQTAQTSIRTIAEKSTRTITFAPNEKLVQIRSRMLNAITPHNPQPLMKIDDHTEKPTTVAARDTSPIRNEAPRNKLHLAIHYQKPKASSL